MSKIKLDNRKLKKIVEQSIKDIIGGENGINEKATYLLKKHKQKLHFIPIKYRVLGGFLQSLNIKFGIFIEVLLPKLIAEVEPGIEVVKKFSGKKNARLSLEQQCERKIDEYINHPPAKYNDAIFDNLLSEAFELQNNIKSQFIAETYDVDLLLKKNDVYYYIEIKYNDDHDTGKFKDINRKFLKTFAGLIHELKIKTKNNFRPILYYFNENVRYIDVFLKEDTYVLRGKKLFEKLRLSITYSDIETLLSQISDSLEKEFDEIRSKIFKIVKNQSL